jgi:hypothetical protein
MSSVITREQAISEPGLRYGQNSSLRVSKTSRVLNHRKSPSRGLLRGSSSLWWVGRKYHRLDQAHETADHSNDSSSRPSLPPINTVEVKASPQAKSKRRIRWNERVRVRRFEKISPELIEDCYYSEAELYGFQREFAVEVDMEDFDDDQSDENV